MNLSHHNYYLKILFHSISQQTFELSSYNKGSLSSDDKDTDTTLSEYRN